MARVYGRGEKVQNGSGVSHEGLPTSPETRSYKRSMRGRKSGAADCGVRGLSGCVGRWPGRGDRTGHGPERSSGQILKALQAPADVRQREMRELAGKLTQFQSEKRKAMDLRTICLVCCLKHAQLECQLGGRGGHHDHLTTDTLGGCAEIHRDWPPWLVTPMGDGVKGRDRVLGVDVER